MIHVKEMLVIRAQICLTIINIYCLNHIEADYLEASDYKEPNIIMNKIIVYNVLENVLMQNFYIKNVHI